MLIDAFVCPALIMFCSVH